MTRGIEVYRRPELLLADLLNGAIRGDRDDRGLRFLRALVLAVDDAGGQLENPDASGAVEVVRVDGSRASYKANVGPANPRGAIKARLITDGADRFRAEIDARVFWPLFPPDQLSLPVSAGEHVYVFFEDHRQQHGLWISRVTGHDSANFFSGVDSYVLPSSQQSAMDAFEEPSVGYQRDESSATLSSPADLTGLFNG